MLEVLEDLLAQVTERALEHDLREELLEIPEHGLDEVGAADAAARFVFDTTLRAPFAGTVVRVPLEVGEMAVTAPPDADVTELSIRPAPR